VEGHRDGPFAPPGGWRDPMALLVADTWLATKVQRGRSGSFRQPRMRTKVRSVMGENDTRRADEPAEIGSKRAAVGRDSARSVGR
jgi:hypothetical protein